MPISNYYYCPVCGFEHTEPTHYSDTGISGSQEICPCCGTQFGYDDCASNNDETIKRWENLRRKWVKDGKKWLSTSKKPKGWDAEKQLKKVTLN